MRNGKSSSADDFDGSKQEQLGAIIPDGFHRTTKQRFFTGSYFFFS